MLTLHSIYKYYTPSQPVLKGIALSVARGEIVCLLGPSGCGKTTLLRVVAGLEAADSGEILLEGQNLANVPVHLRNFGFMFQEFALFPHRNVEENIAFGLRMTRQAPAAIQQRVAEMLELVSLPGYGRRSIFELSGGERQRVALGRSLAPHPRLLMLDEPLGSLDRALREELMIDLRAILKKVGQTVIFVTHDQQEALAIADRIAVMNDGEIEQIDTPQRLYQHPKSHFVASFLGFQNLLPATVHANQPLIATTMIGELQLAQPAAAGEYTLLIRPQALRFTSDANAQFAKQLQVESISFRGEQTRLEVSLPNQKDERRLVFTVSSRLDFNVGDRLAVEFDSEQVQLLGDLTR